MDGLPSEFPELRGMERQAPLAGTVTVVMAEGRGVVRLYRELSPAIFGALANEYRRLLRDVMERTGGLQVEVFEDTACAAFLTAKEAALAAASVQRIVATHEWPHKRDLAVSIGVHSGEAGIGWLGPATLRCAILCDAAEGGQIFLSSSTAALLEDQDLGDLTIQDLGEQVTRQTGSRVRAFELLAAVPRNTPESTAPE